MEWYQIISKFADDIVYDWVITHDVRNTHLTTIEIFFISSRLKTSLLINLLLTIVLVKMNLSFML